MRSILFKRCLYLGLLALFPLFLSFAKAHKFYVSVTQVTYSKEEASLQLISRVFVDDLEKLLQTRYKQTLVLDSAKEQDEVNTYIEKYFHKKLHITVDGVPQEFEFLGKKYEDDLLICYLEIKKISNPTVFEVENQLLFDLFEEQQNIIHVKKNSKRKSLILEKENPKGMLKFSE